MNIIKGKLFNFEGKEKQGRYMDKEWLKIAFLV